MKRLSVILSLACLTLHRATAQVTVEVTTEQDQFLPSESLPVAVKITNRSGQPLHLGVEPDWLTFDVEAADDFIVAQNAEVPVIGEFDVGSSQVATKRVDLKPYFNLVRPGRYSIIATVRIKAWGVVISSPAKTFDVVPGAKLWSQNFGVPASGGDSNSPPEVRKYSLEKANFLRSQLRLYVEVSDESEAHVFNVVSVGKMVAFSNPEAQLDRFSNLHVLWQSGASFYTYAVVNPNGGLAKQELYDYVTARPRLSMSDDGNVSVIGGVRRLKPEEMPRVRSPLEVPVPVKQ